MSSPDLGGGGRVISSSEPLRGGRVMSSPALGDVRVMSSPGLEGGGRVMLSLGDITEGRNEGDEVTANSNWKLK